MLFQRLKLVTLVQIYIDMNISELIMIAVFIIALFLINIFLSKRYLSKIAPDKIETVRLIVLSFILGTYYSTAFGGTHGIGFQVALIILTGYLIYRSYRLIKGLNTKEAYQ